MPVDTICQTCGICFQVKPYRAKKGIAKFCSRSCKTKYVCWTPAAIENRRIAKLEGRWSKGYPKGTKHKKPHSLEYRERKKQEQLKYWSEHPNRNKGKDNGNWQGGLTAQSKLRLHRISWIRISKKLIQQIGRCELCGETNKNKLVVHHKERWFISHNDNEENCMVVCNKCHPKIEYRPYKKVKGDDTAKTGIETP